MHHQTLQCMHECILGTATATLSHTLTHTHTPTHTHTHTHTHTQTHTHTLLSCLLWLPVCPLPSVSFRSSRCGNVCSDSRSGTRQEFQCFEKKEQKKKEEAQSGRLS